MHHRENSPLKLLNFLKRALNSHVHVSVLLVGVLSLSLVLTIVHVVPAGHSLTSRIAHWSTFVHVSSTSMANIVPNTCSEATSSYKALTGLLDEPSIQLLAENIPEATPDAPPLVVLPQPLLTHLEYLTLLHYTKGKKNYLEWGSGASTTAVGILADSATSIENQQEWCKQMRSSKLTQFWIMNGVLVYHCIDTGPSGELGIPLGEVDVVKARRYVDVIDSLNHTVYDVVLIDGRFRAACGLKVLDYIDDCSYVFVHDWLTRISRYRILLEFYDEVALLDRLMVLKRRQSYSSSMKAQKDEIMKAALKDYW